MLLSCFESEMLEAVTSKTSRVKHGEPVTTVPNSQEKPRLGSSQRRRHRALLLSAPEYQHRLNPGLTLLHCRDWLIVTSRMQIYLIRIKSRIVIALFTEPRINFFLFLIGGLKEVISWKVMTTVIITWSLKSSLMNVKALAYSNNQKGTHCIFP